MQQPQVIVVGSLNCDVIVQVDRLPSSGETILGHGGALAAGGKGLNQAAAACRSGSATTLVGTIGDDAFGRRLHDYAVEVGIDCSQISVTGAAMTGIATITVSADGANMIAVAPGANHLLGDAALGKAEPAIARADVLLVQLETPYDSVEQALRLARRHGTLSILNPAPADRRALALLSLADVITPNEHELEILVGQTFGDSRVDLRRAMDTLVSRGARNIVVTLGDKGCAALWDGEFICTSAYPVAVVDTTGAGDTFNGALATALARGMAIEAGLRFASAAAAICVTRPSAEGAAPTADEISAFLAQADADSARDMA